ncbi:hypothetical protein [Fibrivirga algicola]|uniref:Uncharacterized protein n=1 Tax=Fibrivirga algicola TaxID=2950420 RepID=A0ABX0QFK5_9BACT|nr:hypothetical protein [Fibrivirga algicola]NID09513.1 hypothetical protein [Fibrivirga algicola]
MKQLLYFLLLLSTIALPSCKKNTDVDPVDGADSTDVGLEPQSSAPGFGDSKARPLGAPFVYPEGIRVVDKPRHDYACWQESVEKNTRLGGGGLVQFCISFQNTTNRVIKLEFPPKTIWIAENLSMQNGVNLKWISVVVPAQSVLVCHINAFCINPPRSPTNLGEQYQSQPIISNHPGLDELVQLVATKKIDFVDYGSAIQNGDIKAFTEAFVAGQLAAEDIARAGRLSSEARQRIAALPDIN